MKYFDGVIVVEGKNDVSHMSSFINSEYVVLNGYELNKETLEYLTYVSKNRKILLITDPDEAGEKIREKFLSKNIRAETILLDYSKCNKHNKHGVAECEKNEILSKLKPYLKDEQEKSQKLTVFDLEKLGILRSKQARICMNTAFFVGSCNTKTLLKRLNYNHITSDMIRDVLEKDNGNK